MRLLLCLLLFFSVACLGVHHAFEIRRRWKWVQCLADSLSILQNEICACKRPLPEALLRCAELFNPTNSFYRMLYAGLHTDMPFACVWNQAVTQFAPHSGEVRHALYALGQQIGRYDAQIQDSAFSACVTFLREYASQEGLLSKTNVRMSRTTCFFFIML